MNNEQLLTAEEVSELFQIDKQRVYELTRRRLLPSVRLGERQLRYSRREMEKFIESGGNVVIEESEDYEDVLGTLRTSNAISPTL